MQLQTTTGEGSAVVTVHYTMTQDSNEAGTYVECEIESVMLEGVDILAALSEDQYNELCIECESASYADAKDAAGERAIEQNQSRRDDELMGVM